MVWRRFGPILGRKKKADNSAEFGGRKGPKTPKNTKFPYIFFLQNPAILGIASRKGVIFDRVTLCFATVSDLSRKKSLLDAVSAHFYFIFDFFETVGHLEGHQCAPPLPCTAGRPGHDIADFGVIWGQFFSDQKSIFYEGLFSPPEPDTARPRPNRRISNSRPLRA